MHALQFFTEMLLDVSNVVHFKEDDNDNDVDEEECDDDGH